ncbi:MAG: hypothetical protein N3E45_03185 [Oscillatoriaceae bacterium SKW80]|nr:hypothetical protein [Oscillatoriaceae bacterium SKYG93]MCX8119825.1 hypothetical protein [Oscillatoriaceae bacterium SKW80]MDW8452070.1 hypothetical protein [Oscillatoriaceae cyanobacterium SKYGB_i_bin93]HIK27491.1 hypothetical protein [Oscillatoriaceae cyanobacterium M7585_C2015_266]
MSQKFHPLVIPSSNTPDIVLSREEEDSLFSSSSGTQSFQLPLEGFFLPDSLTIA